MPPGGTKRVRATPGIETVPGVATRSGKKYNTTHPARDEEQSNPQQDNNEQSNPQPENNARASMGQDQEEHPQSPHLDFSVFDEQTNANEDEVHEELELVPEGK